MGLLRRMPSAAGHELLSGAQINSRAEFEKLPHLAGGAAAGSTVAAGRPRFFGGRTGGLKKVVIEWEVGSLVGALAWCERLGAADPSDMAKQGRFNLSGSTLGDETIPMKLPPEGENLLR